MTQSSNEAWLTKDLSLLEEVSCRLDLRDAVGSAGVFLFGASAGINVVGMFEASCWSLGAFFDETY